MAKNKGTTTVASTPRVTATTKTHFESWECRVISEVKSGKRIYKAEKLKMLRSRVLITEENASVCNYDKVNEMNTFVELYFLQGKNEPFIIPELEY